MEKIARANYTPSVCHINRVDKKWSATGAVIQIQNKLRKQNWNDLF